MELTYSSRVSQEEHKEFTVSLMTIPFTGRITILVVKNYMQLSGMLQNLVTNTYYRECISVYHTHIPVYLYLPMFPVSSQLRPLAVSQLSQTSVQSQQGTGLCFQPNDAQTLQK